MLACWNSPRIPSSPEMRPHLPHRPPLMLRCCSVSHRSFTCSKLSMNCLFLAPYFTLPMEFHSAFKYSKKLTEIYTSLLWADKLSYQHLPFLLLFPTLSGKKCFPLLSLRYCQFSVLSFTLLEGCLARSSQHAENV